MKRRILLIDDEKKLLQLFSKILESETRAIHTASSGHEALDWMKTTAFDLILLDLKMPGMSGPETLRAIREIDPNVPVYIVTAFHTEYREELRELITDGIAFEILNKPIENDQLLHAVQSALEGPLTL